jgi:hypothetical protein
MWLIFFTKYMTKLLSLAHNGEAKVGTLDFLKQQNTTYPEAGYPDSQISGSAWPFG